MDLIEFATRALALGRRGSPTALHWLHQLPEEVVRERPRLCLFFARILFLAAQFPEASSWLDAAEAGTTHSTEPEGIAQATSRSGLSQQERRALLGELLSYRAVIAGHYGESQTARSLSQQVLPHVTDQDVYERASIASAQALAAQAEGDVSSGIHHAFAMSTLMQAEDNVGAAVSFLCIAASLLHLQGQLQAAWQTYQEAIALGTGPENVPFTAVGLAYAYQADLYPREGCASRRAGGLHPFLCGRRNPHRDVALLPPDPGTEAGTNSLSRYGARLVPFPGHPQGAIAT
jgi:hypothetical protein